MKLSEIVDALDATLLTGEDKLDKVITRCGASDLMSDVLAAVSEDCILLTGLTTVQVIRTAMVAGVGAVAATVMGRGDRGQRLPAQLFQALENLPGAGTSGDGHAAVPTIRGMPQHRTLLLLDDGRVSSTSMHSFGSATLDEGSPHFADQAPLFAMMQEKPVYLELDDLLRHASRDYTPLDPDR